MLQALKLDPSPRHSAPRDTESAGDSTDSSFAGCLALVAAAPSPSRPHQAPVERPNSPATPSENSGFVLSSEPAAAPQPLPVRDTPTTEGNKAEVAEDLQVLSDSVDKTLQAQPKSAEQPSAGLSFPPIALPTTESTPPASSAPVIPAMPEVASSQPAGTPVLPTRDAAVQPGMPTPPPPTSVTPVPVNSDPTTFEPALTTRPIPLEPALSGNVSPQTHQALASAQRPTPITFATHVQAGNIPTTFEPAEALSPISGEATLSSNVPTQTLASALSPISGGAAPTATAPVQAEQSISSAQAQLALTKATPGVQFHFQFSEGGPREALPSTAKQALTELLSVPRPEMEVPLPADQAFLALLKASATLPGVVAPPSTSTPDSAPASIPPQTPAQVPQLVPVAVNPPAPEAVFAFLTPLTKAPLTVQTPVTVLPATTTASNPPVPEATFVAMIPTRPKMENQPHPLAILQPTGSENLPRTRSTPITRELPWPRLDLPESTPLPKPAVESRQLSRQEAHLLPPATKDATPAAPATSAPPEAFSSPSEAKSSALARESAAMVLKPSLPGETSLAVNASPFPSGVSPLDQIAPVRASGAAQQNLAHSTFTQVDGTIRWLIKNQEKGAELQLNPESLGRVTIKLHIEGGEVHARLWASEATTLPLLQDQKAALEASLRQQGLTLGSFDLQHGHRGNDTPTAMHQGLHDSGAKFAESLTGKQEVPTIASPILDGTRLVEVFA